MANPNIVNVTTILGETVVAVATTSFADLVSTSGKVYKINSLITTNTDVSNDVIRHIKYNKESKRWRQ